MTANPSILPPQMQGENEIIDLVPVEPQMPGAVVAQPDRQLPAIRMSDLMNLSISLLKSGMLPNSLRRPEQVAAIILRGRELGIGPMEALMSINVIRGKVVSSTQLMLALIYRSGLLEDIKMDRGDPATVTMKRIGMSPHTVTFGSKEAKRADLVKSDGAYEKWPEVMYMWRAVAICARVVFPDVVGAVYAPDELGVEMRSDISERDDAEDTSYTYEWTQEDAMRVSGAKAFVPPGARNAVEQLVEEIAGENAIEKMIKEMAKEHSVEEIAEELGVARPVVMAALEGEK